MRRLVQFVRDLALLPDIWRRAVEDTRQSIASVQKSRARSFLDWAQRELDLSEGPLDDRDWTQKFVTHRRAKADFEALSAEDAAAFARSKAFMSPRARSSRETSVQPSETDIQLRTDAGAVAELHPHAPETAPSAGQSDQSVSP